MTKHIQFGTSGHRGIIGEAFTNDHVMAIALAIADYVKGTHPTPKVIIGYDPRTGNSPELAPHSFTDNLVTTLSQNGVSVLFCHVYTPTPTISWAIRHFELQGGIILTASHNPPNYNGIKFNPSNGAPAPKSVTDQLETKANQYFLSPPPPATNTPATIETINCIPLFVEETLYMIERTLSYDINLSGIPVAVDAKNGTAGPVWDAFFKACQIDTYTIVNKDPDPQFGGQDPNPTKLETLSSLINAQQAIKAPLAIANDPDTDRHVILDENGKGLTPEIVTAIIARYFLETGQPVQGIATTLASSQIIKTLCDSHQIQFEETEVGFKYFAPFLESCTDKIGLAVESSGGFSLSCHTREKCGFLPGLLLLIILKTTQKSLTELQAEVEEAYGKRYFSESEFQFESAQKDTITHLLATITQPDLDKEIDDIESINQTDGLKITFTNGDWVLCRLSGTEPLARIYSESSSKENTIQEKVINWLNSRILPA